MYLSYAIMYLSYAIMCLSYAIINKIHHLAYLVALSNLCVCVLIVKVRLLNITHQDSIKTSMYFDLIDGTTIDMCNV